MDEIDLLTANLVQMSSHSSSIVPSNGGEQSLTCSGTFAAVPGSEKGRLSSTPSSDRVFVNKTVRAWILGDHTSEMLNALVALGVQVDNIRIWANLRWFHDGRMELLHQERPDLLLILAPNSMRGGEQAATHSRKLGDLILSQARMGSHVAFYGNPMWPVWDPSSAPAGWREALTEPSLHVTELRWCNMGLRHPQSKQGFWTKTRILSSMILFEGDGCSVACQCQRGPNPRGHAKHTDLHADRYGLRERLWTRINYYIAALILSGKPLSASTLGPGIRPELLMNGCQLTGTPAPGLADQRHVTRALRPDPKSLNAANDGAKVSALVALTPSASGTRRGGEPSCTCGDRSVGAPQSFPTDQRARQKARKAQGHVAKKLPQVVENHHDDCGEDFGPLGDDYFADESHDHPNELVSDSEDEICCLVDFDHGLNGSTFEPEKQQDHSAASSPMIFDDLESFTAWNASIGGEQSLTGRHYHDAAELCGGAGGTGTLLVRRGWRKGPNFDIIVGFDLLKPDAKDHFLRYLDVSKPTVLIISTPCTGMKGSSAINRIKNHSTWLRSRRTSVPLAHLGGLAALKQMNAGRHFIAEHPQGSDMWSMPIWRTIQHLGMARAIVHQCMAGLRGSKSGLPVMKPTQFLASDEALVAYLQNLRCDGTHRHAQLDNPAGAHGDKAKDAARWPPQLCHRIARGCEDLLRRVKRRTGKVVSHHQPAGKSSAGMKRNAKIASTPSSTRPRTPRKVRFLDSHCECCVPEAPAPASESFPAGSSSDGECIGCKRNRVQTDPEHNRIAGQCRFPHVENVVYDCPGCRERAPYASDRHTLVPGECRVPDVRFRRLGSVPASGSGGPRGAVTPAASEPTAGMRPGAPAPDAPEEVDPLPEPREPPAPRRPPAWQQPLSAPRTPPGARAPTRNAAVEPPAAEGEADEDDARPGEAAEANGGEPSPTRAPRARGVEAGTQADSGSAEWTSYDLRRAMRLLHSTNDGVVRRTIRRLHVRFWHASAAKLVEILRLAGAPKDAFKRVKAIVDTCRVCRLWANHPPKSMTSTISCSGTSCSTAR